MYSKHLYCFVMSSKTQMADIRLDSDEISFLKKNEIEYQKKIEAYFGKKPMYDMGNASQKAVDWLVNKMKEK